MPPSPAMRCSPGRELRAENHKRGRSLESGILFREKDDDLTLFNEVQSRERDNFLLQSNDDFEDLFSNKLRYFSDYKLGITIPPRGESSDLLNAEGDKNDYDWLLTPPDTPLFPSLDDEAPAVNLAQRGRPRSQPISISRSTTMERSHRSSRGSASPIRLSPSPQSSISTYQPRGRQSPGPHSSPPPGLRPSTPTRRPSPPPSKPSTPAPRSSTPTPRRMSTGSSVPAGPSRVRGNSPVKTNRGNSASPKIKAWQANIPGFSLEAPPNLRTSLADRPASYVRGSSPASRNGSKSGRQSMSPTASRSVCSSYSNDRDQFSSHSKGSVASSGDDDIDSLHSIPVSCSDHSAPRSISTFSNSRALSTSKKPTKIVTSSSAPKRSLDIAIRQMDHRKVPQNMFRPLLSSVPSSSFYAGKSSAAHRSIMSRNSSVTTSSNASSDLGTSGAHDTEGSEHNQEDITSERIKEACHDMQEEAFAFGKADSVDEKSADKNHEKLPDHHDDCDGHSKLESRVVGYESSSQRDTAPAISVVSEILDAKCDLSDADSFEDNILCSRCGCKYRVTEENDGDLKLCIDCRSAEIFSVVTSSKTMMVGENSPSVSANSLDPISADAFVPSVAKPVSLAVTAMGESETGSYSDPNRNLLPQSTDAQGIQILISQQVGNLQSLSSNTTVNWETVDQKLQNTGGYSNSDADVSEGAGISLLLTSSSGRGPIVRSKTFTATSITCDDFSYVRDSATSTRSSFGRGTASASSSLDLGSGRQTEARAQRQISSRMSDTENYRYEMYMKQQCSTSSLSGTSTHGFQASSLATSSHEENSELSAIHTEKGNLEGTHVALQDLSLASESIEFDIVSINIESDNNWKTVSEESSHTTNKHVGDNSMATDLNLEEPALHEYEDLANDSQSGFSTKASSTHPETCREEDAMSNASTDRVDVTEAPNSSTLDAISELASENDHVVSPDSVFDINSQNSESSMDDLQDPSHLVASSNDIAASMEEPINEDPMDHEHSILATEESAVVVEGQGGTHARSLTLEEATDTILFCSSIVHNMAYEAASIAIEKENFVQLEGSKPVLTPMGKSNPDRRDSRARIVSRRNTKPQKARQRQLETDSKPPPGNTATEEKSSVSTTRIVGAPNKGDSMKPPKLESKCNCAIM